VELKYIAPVTGTSFCPEKQRSRSEKDEV